MNKILFFKTGAIILFLMFTVICDIRERKVPISIFFVTFLFGVMICILERRNITELLPAFIPGIAMILLSVSFSDNPGKGDGAFLLVMALFYSLKQNLILLLSAIFISSIFSLFLLLIYRMKNKKIKGLKLPFLCFYAPYILLSSIEQMV